jgi:hypothetical protein
MTLGMAAAILAGLLVLAIARLWTEMPAPRPMQPPARPAPPPPRPAPPPAAPGGTTRGEDEDDDLEIEAIPDRILVDHPLIRRAALKAIEQGGVAARRFLIEDDDLYFVPGTLPDPAERERAVAILLQVQVASSADAVDLAEVLWFVQRIMRD